MLELYILDHQFSLSFPGAQMHHNKKDPAQKSSESYGLSTLHLGGVISSSCRRIYAELAPKIAVSVKHRDA